MRKQSTTERNQPIISGRVNRSEQATVKELARNFIVVRINHHLFKTDDVRLNIHASRMKFTLKM